VPVPPFQVSGVHLGPAIHLFGPVSSARIKVVLEIPGFGLEAGEILACFKASDCADCTPKSSRAGHIYRGFSGCSMPRVPFRKLAGQGLICRLTNVRIFSISSSDYPVYSAERRCCVKSAPLDNCQRNPLYCYQNTFISMSFILFPFQEFL
jgi:hypothetical protein